jgi:hypothetical protein
MFKYVVLLGALALAAPGLAVADPRSFTDLTATDPPADTFADPHGLPPGLGGTVPACSVLAQDKDDRNQPNGNGDDKNPDHGNKHCQLQPASR